MPSSTTLVHHPVDLVGLRINLEAVRGKLVEQEEAFFRNSLADRLKIGLYCYKAHIHFAQKDPAKRGQGRKGRNQLTREEISFTAWLAAEVPWLKEATAYKYMKAFRGLGLDELATEQHVDETLADQRRIAASLDGNPEPTLASLVAACAQLLAPPAEEPEPEQQEFNFLKERASELRQECDRVLGLKEQLRGQPDLFKAVCARAYGLLSELTETPWAPASEHSELGHINPDAITL
jgi:hypothetical protein